jgi:hypothetical protein
VENGGRSFEKEFIQFHLRDWLLDIRPQLDWGLNLLPVSPHGCARQPMVRQVSALVEHRAIIPQRQILISVSVDTHHRQRMLELARSALVPVRYRGFGVASLAIFAMGGLPH